MKHPLPWLAALVVPLALVLSRAVESGAAVEPALAGALPVIDASRYSSLQEAIDALPAAGGLVRLPPGTFPIEKPLVVSKSDVRIEGAGTATHIQNVAESGEPALVLEHPDGATSREKELWRIHLSGFRITGNPKSGAGIECRRINEVFIHGVTVSEHGGDGIRLDHCYEDPRIADNLITYNKDAGIRLIGCHDIVVSSNQLEENRDALRCSDGFNLCMTGNNLDDHLGDGVVIENTYGSVVAGNMIEECRGRAVVLDRDCYGITVSANVIAHDQAGGVDLRDAHGSAVSANTFTIMGKDAVRIGRESSRIAVTGNAFSDSSIGGGEVRRGEADREAGGVVLEGTSDVALSGNVFSGLSQGAVTLEGEPARRVLFAGNVLVDVESEHEKLEASVVTDNLEAAEKAGGR